MTKVELIRELAAKTGFTLSVATEAWDAVFALTAQRLLAEGQINVRGFGTFKIVEVRAHLGAPVIPGGPPTHQPPHSRVYFRAGAALKRAIRNRQVPLEGNPEEPIPAEPDNEVAP